MAFYQYRHACTWKLLKHHSSFWLTTNTWKLEQEDHKWRFKTIPKSKSKFVSLISFLSLPFFSYQTNFNLTKKENYFIRSILLSNKLRRRNSFKNISNPKHQKERKEPKLELKSCKGWRKKKEKEMIHLLCWAKVPRTTENPLLSSASLFHTLISKPINKYWAGRNPPAFCSYHFNHPLPSATHCPCPLSLSLS